ncbi:class I adenylate-forming enzyme family protein [Comamonas composti]|uniref:class I adenylate-forming enzyme family protein n=1 Tax=Comamonas composti TaxID=408558 RepID=UPI000421F2F5|nr:AMP-binding protein [Comamonas composti]
MNLLDAFDSAARKTPAKDFLRYQGASISYAHMQQRSRRAAAVLQAQGVGPGDRVALMCFNTPGFVDALFGAWRLGAAVVPVNHKLQGPELQYILAHSKAKVLVFDAALAAVAAATSHDCRHLVTESAGQPPAGVADWDALLASAPEIQGQRPADEDIAQVLYTSGTTGKPKGCLLSHRAVTLSAMTAALGLSITREERTLMAMPIWHSSPLNNWFGGTLYMGGTVVLLREYHPQHFLQSVQDERVTLYFGAPVSFFAPLQMLPNFTDYDLSSVRAWVYGGGPIGAEQAKKLIATYRSDRFYQVYGMTETGPTGTTLYPEEQIERAGSIGRVCLPGVDMRVVCGDDERDARPGEIGEIWLRTDSAMQGYLDDDKATAAAFAPGGWYRTGDLVRLDDAGYLFIVDRSKDMVITGGENVYSKEVEDALSAHPDVADVAVVGKPHPEWGETVVAHVVLRNQAQLQAEDLQLFLADKLARYKIPREFVFATDLPRTPTGKLQKFMLRQR